MRWRCLQRRSSDPEKGFLRSPDQPLNDLVSIRLLERWEEKGHVADLKRTRREIFCLSTIPDRVLAYRPRDWSAIRGLSEGERKSREKYLEIPLPIDEAYGCCGMGLSSMKVVIPLIRIEENPAPFRLQWKPVLRAVTLLLIMIFTGLYLYRYGTQLQLRRRAGGRSEKVPAFNPPIIKGGTIYFGSNDGKVYAVSLEEGEQVWAFQTESTVQSTVVRSEDSVIFTSDGGSTCFLSPEGAEQHRLANPALWRNLAVYTSGDAVVRAFNDRTGTPKPSSPKSPGGYIIVDLKKGIIAILNTEEKTAAAWDRKQQHPLEDLRQNIPRWAGISIRKLLTGQRIAGRDDQVEKT